MLSTFPIWHASLPVNREPLLSWRARVVARGLPVWTRAPEVWLVGTLCTGLNVDLQVSRRKLANILDEDRPDA